MSSYFDSEPLEAFDRVFTRESVTSADFQEKLAEGLCQVLQSYETHWRHSLSFDDSVLRHHTGDIQAALLEVAERNPGGVRALALHCLVGLSIQGTAEHLGWSVESTRAEIAMAHAVLESLLGWVSHQLPPRPERS